MKFAKYGCIPIDIKILMRDSLTRHKIGESVYFGHLQGFSYLSISGSRGCLIWEKQLANIQNWENWTGETLLSILPYHQKHGKLHHRTS